MNTVVFDLGGVLIDWNPRPAYHALLRDLGRPEDPSIIEDFLRGPFRKLHAIAHDSKFPFADSLAEHVQSMPDEAAFIGVMIEKWNDFVREPIDGTVALLERLVDTKTNLYGLSNWPAQTWPPGGHERAQDFSFLRHFKDIIVSGEVGMKKPQADIFRLAQSRFNIRPEETLFIDDLEENIRAAEALAFKTHLFETPEKLEADLVRHGFLAPTAV